MLIHRLTLQDFGLFRGRVEIDLAPRLKYHKTRPVVLIGGTNGAGKTTILDALRLCLYGPLALGERVSLEEYHTYLRECVHREEGMLLHAKSASVGLEFDYGSAGRLQRFHVERSWDCNGRSVTATLAVTRDGVPLDDLEQSHADEFLRDLIPRGVSRLFFFDGEKIQQIAQASDDDTALAEAIRELLGLDLVFRLRGDLSIYSSRMRAPNSPKSLEKELQAIESKIQELQQRRLVLVRHSDQNQSRVDRIKQAIAVVKRQLSRSGGAYATQREALEAEEDQLKLSISEVERDIRDLCAELLPFAFATRLCASLQEQLTVERKLQDWRTHRKLLQEQVEGAKASVEKTLFPDAKSDISAPARQRIADCVRSLLDHLLDVPSDVAEAPLVHGLAENDFERISGAIHRILKEIPKELKSLDTEYEQRSRRLLQVKSALEKIPDDDVVEPLVSKLHDFLRKQGKAEAAASRSKEELESLDHEVHLQLRLREKKETEIQAAAKSSDRQQLVERVQTVLDEYAGELTKARIADLSKAVADCFGQLWRKGDVLHNIRIDPETCSVLLLDKHGQVIPKERLSAGEKQIYAISLLWALARVSGRVLPMVIDTPLARLDSKHRRHLVTRYFPHVSHQVVILSTDTEIDQEYFRELSPFMSHAYHLRYDDLEGRTLLEQGYFWGRKQLEIVE